MYAGAVHNIAGARIATQIILLKQPRACIKLPSICTIALSAMFIGPPLKVTTCCSHGFRLQTPSIPCKCLQYLLKLSLPNQLLQTNY